MANAHPCGIPYFRFMFTLPLRAPPTNHRPCQFHKTVLLLVHFAVTHVTQCTQCVPVPYTDTQSHTTDPWYPERQLCDFVDCFPWDSSAPQRMLVVFSLKLTILLVEHPGDSNHSLDFQTAPFGWVIRMSHRQLGSWNWMQGTTGNKN